MLPFKLIYHPQYNLNLGEHVFPSRKYRLIHDRLLAEGYADTLILSSRCRLPTNRSC
jgi:hypothetical protein